MKREIAELLNDVSDGKGQLYEGYSGRGMFGNETWAVTFDSTEDYTSSLIDAAYQVGVDCGETMGRVNGEFELDDLKNMRTDSMGFGIVVY